MYIAYFDETGDDGYPKYSSPLFVLTSIYLHFQNWKDCYQQIYLFRKHLKDQFNLPISAEIHTKELLLNKGIYRRLNYSETDRLDIVSQIANLISSLNIKCINVTIDKTKITTKNEKTYKNILDSALNFNIQRVENYIKKTEPGSKFMIITDEGRVGSMRQTTRKIQKINFIPSQFSSIACRQEIQLLIEDPLPKNSKDSYFIQISDFISYFVYLSIIGKPQWHNRLDWLTEPDLSKIITLLAPIFNLDASKNHKFGFVIYPK